MIILDIDLVKGKYKPKTFFRLKNSFATQIHPCLYREVCILTRYHFKMKTIIFFFTHEGWSKDKVYDLSLGGLGIEFYWLKNKWKLVWLKTNGYFVWIFEY